MIKNERTRKTNAGKNWKKNRQNNHGKVQFKEFNKKNLNWLAHLDTKCDGGVCAGLLKVLLVTLVG